MHEPAARDDRSVWVWAVIASAIVAQQVGSKAVRDGLFLKQVAAAQLPEAMLIAAGLSVPIVLGAAAALTRFGPRRVACGLLWFSGSLFAVEWALYELAPRSVAWLVYLHVATLGGTAISAFFSDVAEHFDPHAARRASSRIVTGAAVGGLVGGIMVSLFARYLATRSLLLTLAVIDVACGLALLCMRAQQGVKINVRSTFVLASLRNSTYLRSIVYLVFMTGFVSALLDFSFKAQAAVTLHGPELLQLFAAFHTATALITTLVQLALARRALDRLGLAGTLSVLPASILLAGALGPLLPVLWSRMLLRGASGVLENSLFRSAYEPLYTPLSQRTRRSTKTLIDVAAGRLGDSAASGALLLLPLLALSQRAAVIALAMAGAAVALYLSLKMQSGYVAALTASLRKGSIRLQEQDVVDAATRMTLSQTHAELAHSRVLAQLAASKTTPVVAEKRAASAITASAVQDAASVPPWLQDAIELSSAEPARVIAVLARAPLEPQLVPIALSLLQHSALVEPVTAALEKVADRSVGQLVDTLLDSSAAIAARRRIPRILRRCTSERAVHGLIEALQAPERELRYRAATSLSARFAKHAETAGLDSATVFALVRKELQTGVGESAEPRHVFALLALALDTEALRLARSALLSGDARQRGTALEYLHNTLPDPLRDELIGWLEANTAPPPPPPPAS